MSGERWGTRRTIGVLVMVLGGLLLAAPGAQALVGQQAAVDIAETAGGPFTATVATFADLGAFSPNPNLAATIDWGDGSPVDTGATVVPLGMCGPEDFCYRVDGSHTYAGAGVFHTIVTITELDLTPVVVMGTATVGAPPPPPPPPPPLAPTAPSVSGAGFSPAPVAGRATVLHFRAASPDAPVGGYEVDLGERGGHFGVIACSDLPPLPGDAASPYLPGTATTFGLGFTFHAAGPHTVNLLVSTGLCGADTSTAESLTVNVGSGRLRAAVRTPAPGLLAGAAQAAGDCGEDLVVPDDSSANAVAAAAVCLVNAERAAAGLPALAVDGRLVASATAHTHAMIDGRFFQHQGPDEPELGARGAATGYSAGMGENIGFGSGSLATASAMVDAWMNSPPHRANILDPRYHGVGMAVIPDAPTGPLTPGATYTTNFGTGDPGTPPPASSPPVPAVTVTLAPRSFRAAPSGPSTSPAGAGMKVSFTLTRAADVVFTVERTLAGRRAGKRCVAPRPANRRARACRRTRRVGSFRQHGTPGPNALRFRGRLAGRRLAPGAYQLRVVATDAAGTVSGPRVVSFRIVRGRG